MDRSSPQPNTFADDAAPSKRFWVAVILTGVAAGLAGGALMQLLYAVEHLAWSYHAGDFLQAVSAASASKRVWNLVLAGVVVAVGAAALPRIFEDPGGDVDSAIWFRSGRVSFWPTVLRAIVSIVSVGLGTSLGRESPIKQAGGALASKLADWARLPPKEMQLLVACGVGAGMASAYNVPLGGALFAAEVLLGSITMRTVIPCMVTSVIATAASWVFLPIAPVYRVPEFSMSFPLLFWSICVGPVLGLISVLVVRAVAWAEANKPSGLQKIVLPMIILPALGALAIAFPQLLGNGKDTVQVAFDNGFSFDLLLALPLLKLIATAACLRSGATGGLFTPTMTLGALAGSALGFIWSRISLGAAPGSYAIVGASAVLAAATQGPLSALVMILELTRHVDATMVPILFAVTGATLVASQLESRSIYSARTSREQRHPQGPMQTGR